MSAPRLWQALAILTAFTDPAVAAGFDRCLTPSGDAGFSVLGVCRAYSEEQKANLARPATKEDLLDLMDAIRDIQNDLSEQQAQINDLQAQIDLINSRLAPKK